MTIGCRCATINPDLSCRVGFCGIAREKTAFYMKGVVRIYTLYKTVGNGQPEIVGYYDNCFEGVAAVEEDMAKNDDVDVGYNLMPDKEEHNGST